MENLEPVFKAGRQSSDNPFEFVLSDESVDRMGDVIRADGWQISEFKNNPIALFGHDHDKVIGVWRKVRVVGKKLMGTLKLAEPGTSELVDTTRSLIEQGVLKAVSVGFRPLEAKPRSAEEPWKGMDYIKSALHEVSVVAVPANSNALAVAKAAYSPEVVKTLFVRADEADPAAVDSQGRPASELVTPKLDKWREFAKSADIY
jgi:HK97 family phage prohead protease